MNTLKILFISTLAFLSGIIFLKGYSWIFLVVVLIIVIYFISNANSNIILGLYFFFAMFFYTTLFDITEYLPFSHIWLLSTLAILLLTIKWIHKRRDISLLIKSPAPSSYLDIIFILFVTWSVITGYYSTNYLQVLKRTASFILIYYFFVKFLRIIFENKIELVNSLFKTLYLLILFQVSIAILVAVIFPEHYISLGYIDPYSSYGRTGSFYGNPNSLGLYSLMLFVLGLFFIFKDNNRSAIYLISFPVCIVASLFSASRGTVLSMGAAIIILLFGLFLLKDKRGIKYLLILLIFVIVSWFIYDFNISSFIQRDIRGQGIEEISSGRIELWKDLIDYTVKNRFLYGCGLGNTKDIITRLGWSVGRAQNSMIDTFIGTGIVGLILFTLLIFKPVIDMIRMMFRNINKKTKKTMLLLFVICSTLITHSIFDQTIDSPAGISFQLFLMCILYANIMRHDINKS